MKVPSKILENEAYGRRVGEIFPQAREGVTTRLGYLIEYVRSVNAPNWGWHSGEDWVVLDDQTEVINNPFP